MKKLIVIAVGLSLFLSGAASAVIVRNINKTVMTSIDIDLEWSTGLTEIEAASLKAKGTMVDDTGARAGNFNVNIPYGDLSPQLQASVRNLIMFVGREVNNTKVNEDVAPTLGQDM